MAITITIRNNGPYFIAPDQVDQVTIVDHEGNVIARPGKAIALCRCGASSTKPFCDGTHSKIGFQGARAAAEAFDRQQAQGAAPGAPPASAGGAGGAGGTAGASGDAAGGASGGAAPA